jgi:glycosidase
MDYLNAELVINHTSDDHPWFQRARRGKKLRRCWREDRRTPI